MKMEPIVSSETSAIRTQTPEELPKKEQITFRTRLRSPAYEDGTDSEFRNVGN